MTGHKPRKLPRGINCDRHICLVEMIETSVVRANYAVACNEEEILGDAIYDHDNYVEQ